MEKIDKSVAFLKALSDWSRFKIVIILKEQDSCCVKDLAKQLGISPSGTSHQLRILKEHNIVDSRRSGKEVIYFLADDHVKTIVDQVIVHVEHS